MGSFFILAPLSGPGEHLTRKLGSLAALNFATLSSLAPTAVFSMPEAELLSFPASDTTLASAEGVRVEAGALGLTAGDWGAAELPLCNCWDSSKAMVVLTPAEAGRTEVLLLLLLLLLLGARAMAVIFTTFTELTWGVGITVFIGLLVMSNVGGERSVMALVAEGLGRIWAYRVLCRASRSPTGLAEIF